MKYLVMIQASQAEYEAMRGKASGAGPAWGEKDLRAMYSFMEKLNGDLTETGEMVDGQGLSEPARARTVALGADGRPVSSDGPYGDTEELLCGYWVLDCASLERVTEIAERILQCPGPEGVTNHPVTIRPIMEGGGDMR
ncbi:YciI family protein [Streptomyces sp. NPDC006552]|uniref:YciI family protein n=1 Tax=Streptomyces sp. NPDC006552 TaxID=3157179 RepID=UPI0033BC039C